MNSVETRMKQCFISHCTDDKCFLDKLESILLGYFDKDRYKFFYTSGKNYGTLTGSRLNEAIHKALEDSDLMIAVITDSYLRSIIAISEISVFWHLKKPILPIIFSKAGKDFLEELMGERLIYIDLGDKTKEHINKCATDMITTLKDNEFLPNNNAIAIEAFTAFFLKGYQIPAKRPYIGSSEVFDNINKMCEQYGITRFSDRPVSFDEVIKRIANCKKLFIVATNGTNLIEQLTTRFLPLALANGMSLTVLIPNRCSSYVSDVAEIEMPSNIEDNKERLRRSFENVINNLKDCLRRAKELCPEGCGDIYVGCSYTLIRQTITLAVWEDRFWGQLSVTMPPHRTNDGTPSLVFSGSGEGTSLGKLIYDHVLAIRDVAARRNSYYRLSPESDFHEFYLENEDAKAYWKDLYETAKSKTLSREREGEEELIEVAAYHPLRPNGKPKQEFSKRLDRAVALYRQLQNEEKDVKIYVPGSIHCFKGKADPCSLSEAGRKYLIAAGIPDADILGENENKYYKGEQGVYNTADECYVASRIFYDGDYRRLHCICSPNQLLRKKLFYIAFGVIPFYYTVSTEDMAHNDIHEIFHTIPDIIAFDHTWQDANSIQGKRTRAERKPQSLV